MKEQLIEVLDMFSAYYNKRIKDINIKNNKLEIVFTEKSEGNYKAIADVYKILESSGWEIKDPDAYEVKDLNTIVFDLEKPDTTYIDLIIKESLLNHYLDKLNIERDEVKRQNIIKELTHIQRDINQLRKLL